MMHFEGMEAAQEFEKAFGKEVKDLNEKQIRWLMDFARHVRGRCRSNTALVNSLTRTFSGHTFRVKEDGYIEIQPK